MMARHVVLPSHINKTDKFVSMTLPWWMSVFHGGEGQIGESAGYIVARWWIVSIVGAFGMVYDLEIGVVRAIVLHIHVERTLAVPFSSVGMSKDSSRDEGRNAAY
jgi:hypothetical protein